MNSDAFKRFLEEYISAGHEHLISETLELLPRTLNSLHRFGYTTVEQILEDIQKYGEEEFMRRIPHFGVSQFSDLNTALIKFQTNNTMES